MRLEQGLELRLAAASVPTSAKQLLVSIRPEKIFVSKQRPAAENVFAAVVVEEIFQGATDWLVLKADGGLQLSALLANDSALSETIVRGDRVFCALHADDLSLCRRCDMFPP